MEVIQVESAAAMSKAVAAVLAKLSQKRTEGAVVIALTGELGAGKTTFVQTLAVTLGIAGVVTSPTYVVMKLYELEADHLPVSIAAFTKLIHIDAYRIEALDEMRVLGFSELLKKNDTIICIEWPERIAGLLPPDCINVSLIVDGDGREITIS